ncbi:MAG: DUF5103 domain-containing protein [Prevotellaceae bacterium]|jgi:hypothetical protein|nr:DUF5103 domain-containing protein [Prevotellaceae bacterium]
MNKSGYNQLVLRIGKLLFVMLLTLANRTAYSQDIQTVNAKAGFKDFCFSDKINSVQLFKTGDRFADPVIRLNSDETVTLIFDELIHDDDIEDDYYYTIEHRDANWQEENLIVSDYMSGFPENYIDNVEQSQGTVRSYRNFTLTLPNKDMSLKLSGNYLIKVFERNSGKLALVKGFSIVEPLAAISASTIAPAMESPCMQQFSVKVTYPLLKVVDAYRNLKIRIERNFTAVPGVENLSPSFVLPNSTEYARPDRNIFNGGNEYRAFDIRSLVYNGQGVARHSFEGVHRVELVQDEERSEYLSARDINGKYMIAADNSTNPDIQAEYVDVLFSFVPKKSLEGRIFLFGELTNWSVSNRYEMLYLDGSYKCIVPLKQGFYNYQYVILDKNGNPDMYAAEGCFYETENVYNVYVYYRLPEHRYDRLTALQRVKN